MSTYSLTGTGIQALSANVTAVHLDITTTWPRSGTGRANPAALYDVGLLRFGDATGFFVPIPISGGPQWVAVPNGTTRVGYVVFGTGVVSLVEVIGGTPPFGVSAGPLSGLSDVVITSPADGDLLTYSSGLTKWINSPPAAAILPVVLLNVSSSGTIMNNAAIAAATWTNVWSSQTFTPTNATRPLLLCITGDVWVGAGTAAGVTARANIDSGGTIVQLGGGWHGSTFFANVLSGNSAKVLAAMSAAAHTLQLQVYSEVADAGYLLASRVPTSLSIAIVQL